MESTDVSTPIGYAWAIVLGLTQGLTEFLPVSSSGHLVLIEHLGRGQPEEIAFDLLLHLATVIVVIGVFWKDFINYWRTERRVVWLLIAGTIPAVVIGLIFRHELNAVRNSPILVCVALLITAMALVAAERIKTKEEPLIRLGFGGSILIGLCQALAIVPGISRSGSTISAGIVCGLKREDAVKFSFMLMVPIVLGAPLPDIIENPSAITNITPGPALAGFTTALVSGFFALKGLIRLVRSRNLLYFAAYCTMVATTGLIYFGLKNG